MAQPLHKIQINPVKVSRVVLREICLGGCHAPVILTCVRLSLAHNHLVQRCLRESIWTYECNLVAFVHHKADVVQYRFAFKGLGDAVYRQKLLACFALGFEVKERIFPVRRTNIIQSNLVELLLTGSSLLRLGSVSREPLNERLQFLDLLFLLLIGIPS
ncbi:hypothetical protein D3C72_1131930 [compost metagenome]